MSEDSITLQEALCFRLSNGMMLGQLSEADWRQELARVDAELKELGTLDPGFMTSGDRERFRSRLEHAVGMHEALLAIMSHRSAPKRTG